MGISRVGAASRAVRRYCTRRAYCLLSTRPPVLYLQDWLLTQLDSPVRLLFELLRWRRAYLLVTTSWSHESDHVAARAAARIRSHRHWYGDHRVIYLCNAAAEVETLARAGVDAILCNQNAFLSEGLFYPDPTVGKRFDAIYDASFIAYKRHHLAAKIESLALSGYLKQDSPRDAMATVQRQLAHAHWLKGGPGNTNPWVSDEQVNRMLNMCRVGLCLSAEEGAMYASGQYLLAGLPVVTTHNKGGRDTLFSPACVRWVDDHPDAVAAAVRELVADPPDPQTVHEATLRLMAPHRQSLVDIVNDIYRREDVSGEWLQHWHAGLPNKLHSTTTPVSSVVSALLFNRQLWRPAPAE